MINSKVLVCLLYISAIFISVNSQPIISTQACQISTQCPENSICNNGVCGFFPCTVDANCPITNVCVDFVCQPGCTTNANCPVFTVCSLGHCVQCAADADCAAIGLITGVKMSCVDDVCIKACTSVADCPLGDLCDTDPASPTAGQCVACRIGTPANPINDCGGNKVCSPRNKCVNNCLTRGCNRGQKCTDGGCVQCTDPSQCPICRAPRARVCQTGRCRCR